MDGGLLRDVVVAEASGVVELLSTEDESLLVSGHTLAVLNLCLDGLDCVRGLDVESHGLSSEGLYENLHHSTPESEY